MVNPSLYAKNPYDPYKDFAPVTRAAASPNVLVVHPIDSGQDGEGAGRAAAEANPGKYTIANPGIGTTPQLAAELFKLKFKLDAASVPFQGAGPAMQSAVAGHTPIAFSALPPTAPLVQAGKLRALAVTSAKRSAALPDVPTMAEAGLADQESETMQGIFVPAGTPPAIVDQLNAEIAKIDGAARREGENAPQLGFDVVADTPEEFSAYIKKEVDKWASVIKDAKMTISSASR